MSQVMIPVASITANLSADLSYNPNIHVQTVEIDRTGSVMSSVATDNFVKWFLSNKSLANSLRIATNAETTMDASKNVGDISLSVASQSSFNIGDQVIISDGSSSEVHVISAFGSLVFGQPLANAYGPGTTVKRKNEDVSNAIFTMDASAGLLMTDASAAVLRVAAQTKTYTIPLHSPTVNYGTPDDLSLASRIGYVGDVSVNYQRLHYGSDGSTPVHNIDARSTMWSFVDSSMVLTVDWGAVDLDGSNVVSVTAHAGTQLRATKPYNDAAVDFIQLKIHNDEFQPHGRTNSNADIVSTSIDYGQKFNEITGGTIRFTAGLPTLTVDDVALTRGLQQAFMSDGKSRPITDTASLQSIVKESIEKRQIHGFQASSGIPATFTSTIGGQSNSGNDVTASLQPMIFMRYREPTRMTIASLDPYGEGDAGDEPTSYIHVVGIDASGDVDNVDNVDDGVLTAKIQLYNNTEISFNAYEVLGIRHSLFDNPNSESWNDVSYDSWMYKIDFSGQNFFLNNSGSTPRPNDISGLTVNGIALKVGREKSDLTEVYPSTSNDIDYIYMVNAVLSQSIEVTPIPAVTAQIAMATQTSIRGIMSFEGGYDLRISDKYPGATTGDHRVCLYKTVGQTETMVADAVGTTSINADEQYKYVFVNDVDNNKFTLWINMEKQWNVGTTDVTYKSDLGGIDKMGTTYLDVEATRVSPVTGKLSDLKVYDSVVSETDIEEATLPPAKIEWSMRSGKPEVGDEDIKLASGASLGSLTFKAAPRPPAKPPPIVAMDPLSTTTYTMGVDKCDLSYAVSKIPGQFAVHLTYRTDDGLVDASINSGTIGKKDRTFNLSIPIDNSSGYTISDVSMINARTGKQHAVHADYNGFTIPASSIWAPPTGSNFSTMTTLGGTYRMVVGKTVKVEFELTGGGALHTATASDLIYQIKETVNDVSTNLDLAAIDLSINTTSKKISFDRMVTSANHDHTYELRLLQPNSIIYKTAFSATVPKETIFKFPDISFTVRDAPYDVSLISVGNDLTMTSTFKTVLDPALTALVDIVDACGSRPSTTTTIVGSDVSYQFTIANDEAHSGTVGLVLGDISKGYTWTSELSGNHIHSFPSSVDVSSVDTTNPELASGKHLVVGMPGKLRFTFNGGDGFINPSSVPGGNFGRYNLNVVKISYGLIGESIDVCANTDFDLMYIASSNNYIDISNIVASGVDMVSFNITLRGPDGFESSVGAYLQKAQIQSDNPYENTLSHSGAELMVKFDFNEMYKDFSNGGTVSKTDVQDIFSNTTSDTTDLDYQTYMGGDQYAAHYDSLIIKDIQSNGTWIESRNMGDGAVNFFWNESPTGLRYYFDSGHGTGTPFYIHGQFVMESSNRQPLEDRNTHRHRQQEFRDKIVGYVYHMVVHLPGDILFENTQYGGYNSARFAIGGDSISFSKLDTGLMTMSSLIEGLAYDTVSIEIPHYMRDQLVVITIAFNYNITVPSQEAGFVAEAKKFMKFYINGELYTGEWYRSPTQSGILSGGGRVVITDAHLHQRFIQGYLSPQNWSNIRQIVSGNYPANNTWPQWRQNGSVTQRDHYDDAKRYFGLSKSDFHSSNQTVNPDSGFGVAEVFQEWSAVEISAQLVKKKADEFIAKWGIVKSVPDMHVNSGPFTYVNLSVNFPRPEFMYKVTKGTAKVSFYENRYVTNQYYWYDKADSMTNRAIVPASNYNFHVSYFFNVDGTSRGPNIWSTVPSELQGCTHFKQSHYISQQSSRFYHADLKIGMVVTNQSSDAEVELYELHMNYELGGRTQTVMEGEGWTQIYSNAMNDSHSLLAASSGNGYSVYRKVMRYGITATYTGLSATYDSPNVLKIGTPSQLRFSFTSIVRDIIHSDVYSTQFSTAGVTYVTTADASAVDVSSADISLNDLVNNTLVVSNVVATHIADVSFSFSMKNVAGVDQEVVTVVVPSTQVEPSGIAVPTPGFPMSSSTMYTRGFTTYNHEIAFDRPLTNYRVDASYTSTDDLDSGSTYYSATGSTATLSFLINNSSGYDISDILLTHVPTGTSVFLDKATYGTSISASEIWNPLNLDPAVSSGSSITSPYMLVKSHSCRLRLQFAGSHEFYEPYTVASPTDILRTLEVSNNGLGYTDLSLIAQNAQLHHGGQRRLEFDYTAQNTLPHDFRVRFRGQDGVQVDLDYVVSVSAEAMYSFPTMTGVTKNPAGMITKGERLTCTSNFNATLPSSLSYSSTMTAYGFEGQPIVGTNVSTGGTQYEYSFTVSHDVSYMGVVKLRTGDISNEYTWVTANAPFTMGGNDIYTFPTGMTYSGSIKMNRPGPITFTFSGGDELHSSTVSSQVHYVRWNQFSQDHDVSASSLVCSDPFETVTITDFMPKLHTSDIMLKVKLKGPDGVLGPEMYINVDRGSIVYSSAVPNASVSRYIFMNGTSTPTVASWHNHLYQTPTYVAGTDSRIWDVSGSLESGVRVGVDSDGAGSEDWLIWREKSARSFNSLHYYQTASSVTNMEVVYELFGKNSGTIGGSADAKPTSGGTWTLVGYFKIGAQNAAAGAYVAEQYNQSGTYMNDGTSGNSRPLSSSEFGIWGIVPQRYFGSGGTKQGPLIARIAVNDSAASSLDDDATAVLGASATLSYVVPTDVSAGAVHRYVFPSSDWLGGSAYASHDDSDPSKYAWDTSMGLYSCGLTLITNTDAYPAGKRVLVWREDVIRSFSSLNVYLTNSGYYNYALICSLWGINDVTTMPTAADLKNSRNGWTRIGYYRIGYADNSTDLSGVQQCQQYSDDGGGSYSSMGGSSAPESTRYFGIWALCAEKAIGTYGQAWGGGPRFGRISVNGDVANSLESDKSLNAASSSLGTTDRLKYLDIDVSYVGLSSTFDDGMVLKVNTPSDLLLKFLGEDPIFDDEYDTQVSSIVYQSMPSGAVTTVQQSKATINKATETITIEDVSVNVHEDVSFSIDLHTPFGFVYPTIQMTIPKAEVEPSGTAYIVSQPSLPTTKYTVGSTFTKTYEFDRQMASYVLDGSFASADAQHSGSTTYAYISGTTLATISFPVNRVSNYTVSNLTLRHLKTSTVLDVDDATYAPSLASGSIWEAPTPGALAATTLSSLTSPYLFVNGAKTSVRLTFTGGSNFHSTVSSELLSSMEFSTDGGSTYVSQALSALEPIVIDAAAKRVDFNFTAASANAHDFKLKLRGDDGHVTPDYTFAVGTGSIYTFPTVGLTTKTSVTTYYFQQISTGASSNPRYGFYEESGYTTEVIPVLVKGKEYKFIYRTTNSGHAFKFDAVSGLTITPASVTPVASSNEITISISSSYSGTSVAYRCLAHPDDVNMNGLLNVSDDNYVITLGSSLSLTTGFDSALESNVTASIRITDASGGVFTPSVTKTGSDMSLSYAFTVSNDALHSAELTLSFDTVGKTFPWSSVGTLTAGNIYTFPSDISYDGTSNGYAVGKHLKQETAGGLTLTFTGGDKLHADSAGLQVHSVQYKTGTGGALSSASVATVDSNAETMVLSGVTATAVDDVYFYVRLKGPDGVVSDTSINFTIPSSQVLTNEVNPQYAFNKFTPEHCVYTTDNPPRLKGWTNASLGESYLFTPTSKMVQHASGGYVCSSAGPDSVLTTNTITDFDFRSFLLVGFKPTTRRSDGYPRWTIANPFYKRQQSNSRNEGGGVNDETHLMIGFHHQALPVGNIYVHTKTSGYAEGVRAINTGASSNNFNWYDIFGGQTSTEHERMFAMFIVFDSDASFSDYMAHQKHTWTQNHREVLGWYSGTETNVGSGILEMQFYKDTLSLSKMGEEIERLGSTYSLGWSNIAIADYGASNFSLAFDLAHADRTTNVTRVGSIGSDITGYGEHKGNYTTDTQGGITVPIHGEPEYFKFDIPSPVVTSHFVVVFKHLAGLPSAHLNFVIYPNTGIAAGWYGNANSNGNYRNFSKGSGSPNIQFSTIKPKDNAIYIYDLKKTSTNYTVTMHRYDESGWISETSSSISSTTVLTQFDTYNPNGNHYANQCMCAVYYNPTTVAESSYLPALKSRWEKFSQYYTPLWTSPTFTFKYLKWVVSENTGSYGTYFSHVRFYSQDPLANNLIITTDNGNGAIPITSPSAPTESGGSSWGGNEDRVMRSTYDHPSDANKWRNQNQTHVQIGGGSRTFVWNLNTTITATHVAIGGLGVRSASQAMSHRIAVSASLDGITYHRMYWKMANGNNTQQHTWIPGGAAYYEPSENNGIFEISALSDAPTIGATTKDKSSVQVPETVTFTTAFSSLSGVSSASVAITDLLGGGGAATNVTIKGDNLEYKYLVVNDATHSATITLYISVSGVLVSQSYSLLNVLTAADISPIVWTSAPTIGLTTKDKSNITLGETMTFTTAFDTLSGITSASVNVTDLSDGSGAATSVTMSGTNLQYQYVVANDATHSATVTLNGQESGFAVSKNYSWVTANASLLTAAHIYTFPSGVSYDGTSNGHPNGAHLNVDAASVLVLTFTGGDLLHSSTASAQVSSIQYKTGTGGSLSTATVDSVNLGASTITISGVSVSDADDIYFYVTLKGPDGAAASSSIDFTVVGSDVHVAVQLGSYNNYARWLTFQGYGSKPSNMNHYFEFFGSGFTSSSNLMWNWGGASYSQYGGVNFNNSSHYHVWRQKTLQEYQVLNYHLPYTGGRGCNVSLYGRNTITVLQVDTKPTGSGDGWTLVATGISLSGVYNSSTLGNYSSTGTKVSSTKFSVWAIVWTGNTSHHGPLFTRLAVNDSVSTGWVDDTETTLLTDPGDYIGVYSVNEDNYYQYITEMYILFKDGTRLDNTTLSTYASSGEFQKHVPDLGGYTRPVSNLFTGSFGDFYAPSSSSGSSRMVFSIKLKNKFGGDIDALGGAIACQNGYSADSFKLYSSSINPSTHTDVQNVSGTGDWTDLNISLYIRHPYANPVHYNDLTKPSGYTGP